MSDIKRERAINNIGTRLAQLRVYYAEVKSKEAALNSRLNHVVREHQELHEEIRRLQKRLEELL